ncbi:MAG: WD40 repeat domain-containing protein [Planctomycetes bacterium]|nr:WD40 repeat domain-containing protein [Planctomycetota bacterium]
MVRLYDVRSGRVAGTQKMVESFSPEVKSLMRQFDGQKYGEFPYGAADALAWLLTLKAASPDKGLLTTHQATYVPGRGSEDRFGPDGAVYVSRNWHDTGSSEEEVTVWATRTGRLLHSFYGPFRAPRHVEFSPDGRHFLIGVGQAVAELRSSTTGEVVRAFEPHESNLMQIQFTNAAHVITGTAAGMITLWDIETGEPLSSTTVSGTLTDLDVRNDDQRLVAALGESGAKVFSLPDLKPLQTIPQPTSTVAFSPNGHRLILGMSTGRSQNLERPESTLLLEAESGDLLATVTRQPAREIALSPDTSLALTRPVFRERSRKRFSGRFSLIETASGARLHLFPADSFQFVYNFPPSVAVARDIEATPPVSSRGTDSVGMPFRRYFPQFRFKSKLRREMSEIRQLSGAGHRWLGEMTDLEKTPPALAGPQLVRKGTGSRYSPTVWNRGWRGRRMVVEFDAATARHEYLVPGLVPTAATLNSDGSQLLLACRGEESRDRRKSIAVFNRRSGELIETIDVAQEPVEPAWDIDTLTLSPDDRFLAIGFDYHNFYFDRKRKAMALVGPNNGGLPSRRIVLFSPDSRRGLFFGRRRTLWDLDTARQLADFGPYNGVEHSVFSPAGSTFFARGEDGTRLWEAATGRVIHEFERQHIELRFNADGTRMIPLQYNEDVISLWDFETGEPICPLTEAAARSLIDVIFTPDGSRLIVLQMLDETSLLTVRDARTGQLLASYRDSEFPFYYRSPMPMRQPLFLDKGKRLVIAHPNGVTVLDTRTGKPIHRFRADLERECSLVLTPNRERLLTVSPGGAANLWSLATGEEFVRFDGMPADIDPGSQSVWFSPDGSRLVAYHHRRQSALVWDVDSGELVAHHHLLSDGKSWLTER